MRLLKNTMRMRWTLSERANSERKSAVSQVSEPVGHIGQQQVASSPRTVFMQVLCEASRLQARVSPAQMHSRGLVTATPVVRRLVSVAVQTYYTQLSSKRQLDLSEHESTGLPEASAGHYTIKKSSSRHACASRSQKPTRPSWHARRAKYPFTGATRRRPVKVSLCCCS